MKAFAPAVVTVPASTREAVPECVGIIMDGNRRWAASKGLPSIEGHRAGYQKAKEIIRYAFDHSVDTVIVYAFSTENWQRAADEVGFLMELFATALKEEFGELVLEGVAIRFLGDLTRLPANLRTAALELERTSAKGTSGKTLGIALSYGGRAEIVAAVNKLVESGKKDVTEADVSNALFTAGLTDPDLIIRTSGEQRLSGFLPWQGVYSELFFTNTLWPDFSTHELDTILSVYAARERRIGK